MAVLPDGNLALKLTWISASSGPFSSPCSPQGRQLNIINSPRVWCSHSDCPCYEIYHQHNNAGDYWQYFNKSDFNEWPCYEAMVFRRWQFGTGIYHNGSNQDQPIPIKHWKRGKLAFLTSREPGKPESERRIIGCFDMDRLTTDPNWGNVLHAGSIRLKVADFRNAPLYWRYRKQPTGPRWNTGLFRYIPDTEARYMLNAVTAAAQHARGDGQRSQE